MSNASVDRPIERVLLRGETLGERIADALRQSGITKAGLAKAVGKSWRMVHGWTTNEKSPSADSLRRIAEVLPVTLEELLGVAIGQDPPFEAWSAFLAAEGPSLSVGERRALQSIAWPPHIEPTVASYQIALAAVRSGKERSTAEEREVPAPRPPAKAKPRGM